MKKNNTEALDLRLLFPCPLPSKINC